MDKKELIEIIKDHIERRKSAEKIIKDVEVVLHSAKLKVINAVLHSAS